MPSTAPPKSNVLVLHPFFFGLFPVFSLLSVNLVAAGFLEALLPAATVLGIAAALWLLLWPLLPDTRKRALVLSLFWLPFYGYGAALDLVRARLDFRAMLSPAQVAAAGLVALLVAAVFLYLLQRSPWTFDRATSALNRFAIAALAVALASCLLALGRRQIETEQAAARLPAASTQTGIDAVPVRIGPEECAALPNIYFIICDAYPRADYLQEYFDYDNAPFLEQLRARGFYVADRSRSNYGNTLPSLASTLNLEFLDADIFDLENFKKNYVRLVSLVRDSVVLRTLRAHGYEYVALPSGMFPTMMVGADRFIYPGNFDAGEQLELSETSPTRATRPGAIGLTEYQQALVDMTPIRSILNRIDQLWWYQIVPFSLDRLASLRRQGRPMFVFAHLLAPHVPHAYDRDGNFVETFPPFKEGWRTVTDFLNARLLQVVDEILEQEPNSVILIQGDHGCNSSTPDAQNQYVLPWEGDWRDYVRNRSANLNACYYPDRLYEGLLYPEITSINTFRVLFNKYLKTEFEMLEDVTYLSPRNSTELVRITEVH